MLSVLLKYAQCTKGPLCYKFLFQECKGYLPDLECYNILKTQEYHLRTIIESVDKKHEERMGNQSSNFEYEITKLHEVVKELHELFEKQVSEMKAFLELKVNYLRTSMSKEVKILDDNYNLLHKKVDVLSRATTHLIEDITAFNKDYDLKVKSDKDDKVFEKSSISQDSISSMVSNIETSIKAELAPILNLVLRLPTNAPPSMHVSQGVERGVSLSKRSGEDT
ncbi:unnamed protein product [Lactuca saligna]|uniref:Uncharacterized protein n=1 Tax=Lactuca saligna TaxID=75948 RepID=A0AA35ZLT8_LACSI|nr:unnamed protein product [Lactuca saligna]